MVYVSDAAPRHVRTYCLQIVLVPSYSHPIGFGFVASTLERLVGARIACGITCGSRERMIFSSACNARRFSTRQHYQSHGARVAISRIPALLHSCLRHSLPFRVFGTMGNNGGMPCHVPSLYSFRLIALRFCTTLSSHIKIGDALADNSSVFVPARSRVRASKAFALKLHMATRIRPQIHVRSHTSLEAAAEMIRLCTIMMRLTLRNAPLARVTRHILQLRAEDELQAQAPQPVVAKFVRRKIVPNTYETRNKIHSEHSSEMQSEQTCRLHIFALIAHIGDHAFKAELTSKPVLGTADT